MQLVELKNGSTFNGHLVACDNFMNLTLREVYETSAVSLFRQVTITSPLVSHGASADARSFDIDFLMDGWDEQQQSGEQFWKQKECYIRGSTVSFFSLFPLLLFFTFNLDSEIVLTFVTLTFSL